VAPRNPIPLAELVRQRAAAAAQRQREVEALIARLADAQSRFEPDFDSTMQAAVAAVAAQQRARECHRRTGLAHDRAAQAHDRAVSLALQQGDLERAARHREQAHKARLTAAYHRSDPATNN
jgi:hypothetical protein